MRKQTRLIISISIGIILLAGMLVFGFYLNSNDHPAGNDNPTIYIIIAFIIPVLMVIFLVLMIFRKRH